MATRIFELAKELGVKSKAIIAKCRAEGIPETSVKNHMASVSAGLEATIREWFTQTDAQHSDGTAVETAEKVDIEKVKVPVRRHAKAKKASKTVQPAAEAQSPAQTEAAEAQGPGQVAVAEALSAGPTAEAPAGDAVPLVQAAERTEPATEATGPESARFGESESHGEIDEPPSQAEPAPMNVPSRPKVVTPAGPRLEQRAPVRLSGPKVVRVEAPDVIDLPRRRRAEPATTGIPMNRGPRGGGGVPVAAPAGDEDRGRSPRRGSNRRRAGDVATTTRRRGGGRTDRGASRGGTWREQDLIEREARLQRSGGYFKKRRQEIRQRAGAADRPAMPVETGGAVTIQAPFTIKDLSAATGVKAGEIVKKLFMQSVMATINSGIDTERAQDIMMEYDIDLQVIEAKSAEQRVTEAFEERQAVDEQPRGPVVTILGHVDHGKTSLLDRIRNTNVAEGEAGGITQATSAFRVSITVGNEQRQVVFLDTPGHEAFTAMRARGANMTDLIVLVVAADDGVMPQTIESINHAKAAGVPIIVALNKIDKPEATDANIQKILGQLAEHELNPVEWGGQTEVIRTSAITGEGIGDLLETLDLQAQLLELKADFGGSARGSVIESRHMEGRGAVANVLIQDGLLSVGDFVVAGPAYGRVRDITDDRGERLKSASPPTPVQISGLDLLPDAGDHFYAVDSLKKAQEAAEQRRQRDREVHLAQPKVTLDSLFGQMAENQVKEILIVLKADVQGSIEVLRSEIEKVKHEEVKVRVLHAAVGGITESDVLLADASRAIIVGFNVIPSAKARQLAETKGVEIRMYQVIYNVVDDVIKAAEGLLTPELRQEIIGHAEVRKVFKVSKVGAIAGCYVTDGVVERDALIRVTRADVVIENDRVLEQLKRFKDDAKDVRANMECGMKIAGYDDIKEGDILECYKQIEVRRTL